MENKMTGTLSIMFVAFILMVICMILPSKVVHCAISVLCLMSVIGALIVKFPLFTIFGWIFNTIIWTTLYIHLYT